MIKRLLKKILVFSPTRALVVIFSVVAAFLLDSEGVFSHYRFAGTTLLWWVKYLLLILGVAYLVIFCLDSSRRTFVQTIIRHGYAIPHKVVSVALVSSLAAFAGSVLLFNVFTCDSVEFVFDSRNNVLVSLDMTYDQVIERLDTPYRSRCEHYTCCMYYPLYLNRKIEAALIRKLLPGSYLRINFNLERVSSIQVMHRLAEYPDYFECPTLNAAKIQRKY